MHVFNIKLFVQECGRQTHRNNQIGLLECPSNEHVVASKCFVALGVDRLSDLEDRSSGPAGFASPTFIEVCYYPSVGSSDLRVLRQLKHVSTLIYS